MTYKEIINRFRTITENHLMLEDFGYGDLSDLKYVSQLGSDEERVGYPYLYLLPSSSTRNGVVMNYSFNMIVMDMARPEDGANTDEYDNYITIQSQCQQYIDDVLANLYYFYKDQPEIELTGITYTPFKEKYQDVVAGMTATITIQVPTPLNECIAPFALEIVRGLNLTDNERQGNVNGGLPSRFYYESTFDPEGVWSNQNMQLTTQQAAEYEISIDQIITLNQPLAGEVIPTAPVLVRTVDFVRTEFEPMQQSGWPTSFVDETTQYRYRATWRTSVPTGIQTFCVQAVELIAQVGIPEGTLQQLPGGTINIKRL